MKRTMLKSFFVILSAAVLSLFSTSIAAEADCAGIQAGIKAYNDNDFEKAIDEWRNCEDGGFKSADLYYNLGNAYFRNGKLGFAILYYKSALRLRPVDADIKHNLAYAQAMTKDKVQEEDEEENPLLSALFTAHHFFSLKMQLLMLLALFWIIVLCAVAYRISLHGKMKNALVGIIFATTGVLCVIGASAGYKIFVAETEVTGVVTAADADVTSEPRDRSQTLNTLSEGTVFEVLSEQGDFLEIKLGERIKGFVRKRDAGTIK